MNAILLGAGAVTAASLFWAWRFERWWVEVTARDIPVEDLPASAEGLTIAHLSDVHFGPYVPLEFVSEVVDRVNALAPDLIALTGDFVDHRPGELEQVVPVLNRLRAPMGVWASFGGHDVRAGERLTRRLFAESRMRLLVNDAAPLRDGPAPFWIAGIHDNSEYHLDNLGRTLAGVPEGARTLLLAHSPDIAWEAADRGVDLVLSGHTHGGQVCLPLVGPLVTESYYWRRFARGLKRAGRTWIYTSRGLGVVRLPFRYFCRPEIALHRLVRAQSQAAQQPGEEEPARIAAGR